MFFSIVDNSISGFLTLIAFLIVIVAIGKPIRRFLNITILDPTLDTIIYAILGSITISLLLDTIHLYKNYAVITIVFIGLFIELQFFVYSAYFLSLQGILVNKFLFKTKITLFIKSMISNFFENRVNALIWILIGIYQILFIILPAIIYPLPLETDMKEHSIILTLIVNQSTTFPSWAPVVPNLGNVIYQLGGHIYAAFGYYIISIFSIPETTFLNFWFRFNFIICFYVIIFLSYKIFGDITNSKLYSAISLIVTPAFFWISRWGGYPWILGFIILCYLIALALEIFIKQSSNYQKKDKIYLICFIWSISLLGFIHINVLFYAFFFINILFIYIVLFRRFSINSSNVFFLVLTFLVDLTYSILIISPDILLQLLPVGIQQILIPTTTPGDIGFVPLYDIVVLNFFIGGLVSTIGLILVFILPTYKNKPATFIVSSWILLMITAVIIIILPIEPLAHIFFYFPGAEYIIKVWRFLFFTFIILAVFSPPFWHFLKNLPYKKISNTLPIIFIILICLFGLISAYSLELPDNRDYSSYTLDAFEFIHNNISAGSLFMNDFRGEWIPLIAPMRITYTADPLYDSNSKFTISVFFTLLDNINDPSLVNTSQLFSPTYFGGKINYIFITVYVFNDIAWKLGNSAATTVSNRSIWGLSAYSVLKLIYSNPEVAIYQLTM